MPNLIRTRKKRKTELQVPETKVHLSNLEVNMLDIVVIHVLNEFQIIRKKRKSIIQAARTRLSTFSTFLNVFWKFSTKSLFCRYEYVTGLKTDNTRLLILSENYFAFISGTCNLVFWVSRGRFRLGIAGFYVSRRLFDRNVWFPALINSLLLLRRACLREYGASDHS